MLSIRNFGNREGWVRDMTQSENLLEIKNLRTYFHTDIGTVKAVDDLVKSQPDISIR